MKSFLPLALLLAAPFALAQTPSTASASESRIHSDFRREWEQLHPCSQQAVQPCKPLTLGNMVDIGQTLFTGQPLHIAVGSLAPQNGFGGGLAFVEHKDFPSEWRLTFDTDAVATPNGSWRAGLYLKAYRLGGGNIVVVQGPGKKQSPLFNVAPLFNVYAQTTSLNHVDYYGLGPNTLPAAKSAFGITETVAGASAIVPLGVAGIAFVGEVNGRVPQLRGDHSESFPSIEELYSNATAPGLASQSAFLEPGVGVRIEPTLFAQHLRLNYLAQFQDYASLGSSASSFRRWTIDLNHEIPLDTKVRLIAPSDQNGPDSCAPTATDKCPSPTHISTAMNHEGSVNFRLLTIGSAANAHSSVPFYFDPTVGGSDMNGQALLPSYPDYRFRAPNLILLRESIEHAIPKAPLGVYFSADQAKAALTRSDIDFSNLRRSYTVGLTVHAGGLPLVYLLFAWGGNEGHHTTFDISNTLIGASARPSLF
ncbi:MAG TPA: hypothetical protein VHZ25_15310 [Acidobacteriaceae bacterium]|jgi:hypothetical protein|nr:hypothetical protein [Acidobacteriaceae bacterium]